MKMTPCTTGPFLQPCSLDGRKYQIDPYVGCAHYCYYCYALNNAVTDWREEVRYHDDLLGRLEAELSGIVPQTIYMGWETDPYQPCEKEGRQTRRILELLQRKGFSVSILTKSDLVLRDLDILTEMSEPSISFSMAFAKDNDRQLFEANTIGTGARVAAMRTLTSEGIKSSVLLCPVIPHVTEVKPVIESVAGLADKIWIYGLSILNRSDQNWKNIEEILASHYGSLKPEIEAVVFDKGHRYWADLREELLQLEQALNLNLIIRV